MSTYTSSLNVIPSNNYNIPQPGNIVKVAAATGSSTTLLKGVGTEFTAKKTRPLGYTINGGDIIYNETQNVSYQVVKVVDDLTIEISTAAVAIAAGDACLIYKGNVAGSEGYSLYFGVGGDVKVDDVSGNTVQLIGIPAGKVIDLQVVKVYSSSPTPPASIVAWEKTN
mgnify:FL=1|tara:strand:+ start:2934 stop:3437 length:504 start_codon:yes stop_codon:yes gene_type:complete